MPAPRFPSSNKAKMQNIKIALAINSEKNWPVRVINGAGYVQKIPAEDVLRPTVRKPWPPSNTSMADI